MSISERGELMAQITDLDESIREAGIQFLVEGKDHELYLRYIERGTEEQAYYFVTELSDNNLLLAEVAPTGEPLSLRVTDDRSNTLETILERDPRGAYHVHKDSFQFIEGREKQKEDPEEMVKFLLRYVHKKSKEVRAPPRGVYEGAEARDFRIVSYGDLRKIYNHTHKVQGDIDIVPDQSASMILARLAVGCNKGCVFCAYGDKPFEVRSKQESNDNLVEERDWQRSMYSRSIRDKDEVFFLASDIARVELAYRAEKTDLSAVEAGKLVRKYMPNASKISAFVDTKTALKVSEDPNGEYILNGKSYSTKFFERLLRKGKISRLIVGWETGHNPGSYALNKHETFNEKVMAAKLIQDAGILLKAVLQLGAWGKGFYDEDGRFYGWRTITNASAKLANAVQPYRLYLSNAYIHNGPAFHARFKTDKFRPYPDFEQGIAKEQTLLENTLKIDYGRRNPMQIEYHYERFIPPSRRSFIVVH